jgi:hypothetical protein
MVPDLFFGIFGSPDAWMSHESMEPMQVAFETKRRMAKGWSAHEQQSTKRQNHIRQGPGTGQRA